MTKSHTPRPQREYESVLTGLSEESPPPGLPHGPLRGGQAPEVPLAALQDPANRHEETWQLRDRTAIVPYFSVENQVVWGATAMMLSELLALVERAQQRTSQEESTRA